MPDSTKLHPTTPLLTLRDLTNHVLGQVCPKSKKLSDCRDFLLATRALTIGG